MKKNLIVLSLASTLLFGTTAFSQQFDGSVLINNGTRNGVAHNSETRSQNGAAYHKGINYDGTRIHNSVAHDSGRMSHNGSEHYSGTRSHSGVVNRNETRNHSVAHDSGRMSHNGSAHHSGTRNHSGTRSHETDRRMNYNGQHYSEVRTNHGVIVNPDGIRHNEKRVYHNELTNAGTRAHRAGINHNEMKIPHDRINRNITRSTPQNGVAKNYLHDHGTHELIIDNNKTAINYKLNPQNRKFIPLRAVLEPLGFTLEWNEKERQVFVNNNEKSISLRIEQDGINVNGITKSIGSAPVIVNDRTYVPIEFLTNILEYHYSVGENGAVMFTSKGLYDNNTHNDVANEGTKTESNHDNDMINGDTKTENNHDNDMTNGNTKTENNHDNDVANEGTKTEDDHDNNIINDNKATENNNSNTTRGNSMMNGHGSTIRGNSMMNGHGSTTRGNSMINNHGK